MVNREQSARNLATEARITCLSQQGERCADELAQGGAGAGTQRAEEGSWRCGGASGDGGPASVRSHAEEQGSCFLKTQPCAVPKRCWCFCLVTLDVKTYFASFHHYKKITHLSHKVKAL